MAAGCRANAPIVSRHDAEQGPASRAFLPNGLGGLPEYPELRDAQPGRGAHAADQVCSSAPVDSYRKAEDCTSEERRVGKECRAGGWRDKGKKREERAMSNVEQDSSTDGS